MHAISIELLGKRLSEYVRLAERGETFLITEHERVIAELRPPSPPPRGKLDMTLEQILADLNESREDRF